MLGMLRLNTGKIYIHFKMNIKKLYFKKLITFQNLQKFNRINGATIPAEKYCK